MPFKKDQRSVGLDPTDVSSPIVRALHRYGLLFLVACAVTAVVIAGRDDWARAVQASICFLLPALWGSYFATSLDQGDTETRSAISLWSGVGLALGTLALAFVVVRSASPVVAAGAVGLVTGSLLVRWEPAAQWRGGGGLDEMIPWVRAFLAFLTVIGIAVVVRL